MLTPEKGGRPHAPQSRALQEVDEGGIPIRGDVHPPNP